MGCCITSLRVRGEDRSPSYLSSSEPSMTLIVSGDPDFKYYRPVESGIIAANVVDQFKETILRNKQLILCESEKLIIGEEIAQAPRWKSLDGGEIYFIMDRSRLGNVFTESDLLQLLFKASEALGAHPSFQISRTRKSLFCSSEIVVGRNSYTNMRNKLSDGSNSENNEISKKRNNRIKWSTKLSPLLETEEL